MVVYYNMILCDRIFDISDTGQFLVWCGVVQLVLSYSAEIICRKWICCFFAVLDLHKTSGVASLLCDV